MLPEGGTVPRVAEGSSTKRPLDGETKKVCVTLTRGISVELWRQEYDSRRFKGKWE